MLRPDCLIEVAPRDVARGCRHLVWDAHQNEARAIFLNPGTNISIEARRMTEDE